MSYNQPRPLPRWEQFLLKFLWGVVISGLVIAVSLSVGAAGYHQFEELPWLDAYLNASMILTGMGPVNPVRTEAGKLFAIGYSLFSGVVFLSACALLFAPVVHRFLHRFHLDLHEGQDDPRDE